MMTYKAEGIEKECYLKTIERESHSYDGFDVDIARGKSSYLRIIKRLKDKSNYIINEVKFEDNEYLALKGKSNKDIGNILIKDYLDFIEFKYPINYEIISEGEYEFSIKIPYNDLLKVPVKKWDFYLDTEFNRLELEENCEFINEKYRIFLKNHGNRMVLELFRYNPIESIEKLKNEKNRINREKQELIKENEQLNLSKNKIAREKQKLVEERKELFEKNEKLKNRINEYKSRKDVRAVDAIKKTIGR